jgi:hypothetical protein
MLDWLWRAYDATYRWYHRVEDLPGESVVRINVAPHRGRTVALGDGTVVRAGDLVGFIHFNNGRVRAIHERTRDPARAGILMRRAFERSLEILARLGEADPRYRTVKAFTALTIFHQGAQRAGFEIFPPRSKLSAKIVAAYGRSLLTRFHPRGAERVRRARFAEARVLWISRAELFRRYAPARSSPRETSS